MYERQMSAMNLSSALVACLTVLAVAAGAQAQTSTVNMQFGGKARNYVLHLPPGGGSRLPLMFILHGFGGNAAGMQSMVKMDAIADREKFVVAYPNAVNGNWDQAGDSDWKFILAVLDSIVAKHAIDRNRVYLTGFSQGAGMAHAGGCRHADRFAAIAPVSGNIPADCKPVRALPMYLTFGTKDMAVPEKYMQSASAWAKLNACSATPTLTRPYPASNPNSLVTRIAWTGCKDGAAVIADSVRGGPHEWPMDTRAKVNSSEEVWAFFSKHSLSGSTALPRATSPSTARKGPVLVAPGLFVQDRVGSGGHPWVFNLGGRRISPIGP